VVWQASIEIGRSRERRAGDEERVAVRRTLRDDIGADGAARACAIVDDDLLAERIPDGFAEKPADDVVWASAGRKRDDEAHWSGGIVLGLCARYREPCGAQENSDEIRVTRCG